MRLRTLFISIIILSFFVAIGFNAGYFISSGQESYNHQVEDYLSSVISVNKERVNDFISEAEKDVLFLSKSGRVEEVLKRDLVVSEEVVRFSVDAIVDIVAKDIENYIVSHPDMTIKDLQESEEFKVIAVQKVGGGGYSVVHDRETNVNYFHKDSKIVNSDLDYLINDFPELVEIIDASDRDGISNGFYDWVDADEKLRRKYVEFRAVPVKTADGVSLVVGATSYVDDYLIAENVSGGLSEYFESFCELRDYHNILLVSGENIAYMAKGMEMLGANVESVFGDLNEAYDIATQLEKDEIGYYGPFFRHAGKPTLHMAFMSKVYDEDEYLGIVIIIKDSDELDEILEKKGYGDYLDRDDEDYLINKNEMLITPLRARDVDLLVQEVRTKNAEACLEDFREARKEGLSADEYEILEMQRGEEFLLFLNFKGDSTLGLHRPIDRFEWCLLSEVSEEGVLSEPMEKSFERHIIFRGGMFLLIVLATLAIGLFIDKRYVLRMKSERELRNNLFSRMIDWFGGSWLANVNLGWVGLFGIVFSIGYFVVVTSFFQGWQNAKVFDAVPDLIIVVILFMILACSLRFKDMKSRNLLVLGSIMICLTKLVEIVFQELQVMNGTLGPECWVPVMFVTFMGIFVLFLGYREVIR